MKVKTVTDDGSPARRPRGTTKATSPKQKYTGLSPQQLGESAKGNEWSTTQLVSFARRNGVRRAEDAGIFAAAAMTDPAEMGEFADELGEGRDFNLVTFAVAAGLTTPEQFGKFLSGNSAHINGRRVSALIASPRLSFDQAQKREAFRQAGVIRDRRVREEAPPEGIERRLVLGADLFPRETPEE